MFSHMINIGRFWMFSLYYVVSELYGSVRSQHLLKERKQTEVPFWKVGEKLPRAFFGNGGTDRLRHEGGGCSRKASRCVCLWGLCRAERTAFVCRVDRWAVTRPVCNCFPFCIHHLCGLPQTPTICPLPPFIPLRLRPLVAASGVVVASCCCCWYRCCTTGRPGRTAAGLVIHRINSPRFRLGIVFTLFLQAGVPLLFWTCANEVTPMSQAKRFYPLFAILGNLGPIASGQTVAYVSRNRPAGMDAEMAFERTLKVIFDR